MSEINVPRRRKRAEHSLIRDAATSATEVPSDPQVPQRRPATAAPAPAPAPARSGPEYRNWNVRLPTELVERIYGACDALADVEDIRSNVGFTVRAMEEFLTRLEAEHNGGRRYHREDNPFKAGRPVSYRPS